MNGFPAKATPLQSHDIQASEMRVISNSGCIGNDIACHSSAAADECVLANAAVLMNRAVSAQKGDIANMNMSANSGAVRKDDLVADSAVMRDMGACHKKSVVAHARHAAAGDGAPMHGDVLSDDIVTTDHEPGRLTLVA